MSGPQWASATVSGGIRQLSAVMLLPFLRTGLTPCVVVPRVVRFAVDLWAPTSRSKAAGRPFYVAGVSAARANTPGARFPRMLVVVAARSTSSALRGKWRRSGPRGRRRHWQYYCNVS